MGKINIVLDGSNKDAEKRLEEIVKQIEKDNQNKD